MKNSQLNLLIANMFVATGILANNLIDTLNAVILAMIWILLGTLSWRAECKK